MLQLRHDASHPGIRIIAPGFVFGEMLFAQAQRRKFVQDRVLVGANCGDHLARADAAGQLR